MPVSVSPAPLQELVSRQIAKDPALVRSIKDKCIALPTIKSKVGCWDARLVDNELLGQIRHVHDLKALLNTTRATYTAKKLEAANRQDAFDTDLRQCVVAQPFAWGAASLSLLAFIYGLPALGAALATTCGVAVGAADVVCTNELVKSYRDLSHVKRSLPGFESSIAELTSRIDQESAAITSQPRFANPNSQAHIQSLL